MLISGGKNARKKPKVEIKDALGNKISLKKLKAAYKEEVLASAISKRDVIKRGILSELKIEKAVKEGAIKEVIFHEQVYFNTQELKEYVQKLMGLKNEEFKCVEIDADMRIAVENVKKAAIEYQRVVGRKLGITGEIGEFLVCDNKKLIKLGYVFKLIKDSQKAGFDAIDEERKRVQIKARRVNHTNGRIGRFSDHEFDYVILAILDDHYEITALYRASYLDIKSLIEESPRRNPRFAQFIEIAKIVWEK